VQENEKRIAGLPPAEQAYERFRFWQTRIPPGQPAAEVMKQYRAHLKGRGFAETDIEQQIKLVQTQGDRSEVQRWNRILTSAKPAFNTKPNDFLVEMVSGRKPGRALDVGMGQGRNAIWLAQQGWSVTGFDPADQAVAVAQKTAAALGLKIQTEIKGTEDFQFGDQQWDLILLSYAGGRDVKDIAPRALRPGGLLVIEGFHRDALRIQSIGGDVVFDTGELPKVFPGLRVVRYEEPVRKADFSESTLRVVRYCAEKPKE
jgi:SAM-dependent methyltransferase